MVQIKVSHSNNVSTNEAFQETVRGLHTNPTLILYFASTSYSFASLDKLFQDKYPNAEIVGLTTVGEINPMGFSENSVSAMSMDGTKFKAKAIMIENIKKYPVFQRDLLKLALEEIGINRFAPDLSKEGIGLVFPNGLLGAEEAMLAVVNSIFKREGFPIFGGTAADDAKFEETMVAVNGSVSSKAGAVIFLKLDKDYYIYKENLFASTGKKLEVTKADTEKRIVYEFNGKKAASEYAKALGVTESNLSNYFMSNPLGRIKNNELWIASPFQVHKDGSIELYCQIFQGDEVEILEAKPIVETIKTSVSTFKNQFSKIEGVLAINCVLRKLQFQTNRIIPAVNEELRVLPNLCGFSSYGEQLYNTQLNQTMILLGFGTRK